MNMSPDQNRLTPQAAREGAEKRFMQIGLAWRVIKDETLRGIYLACFFFLFFTLEPRVE